jgi:hypothetical protein
MICDVCRSACNGLGPVSIHHQTCSGFKRSIDMGCYFCTRLWAGFKVKERDAVLEFAESESEKVDGETEAPLRGKRTSSDSGGITLFSLQEGSGHGHPGCYVLQFSFNASSVLSPEDIAGTRTWRACFLLRPIVSKSNSISSSFIQDNRSIVTINWSLPIKNG